LRLSDLAEEQLRAVRIATCAELRVTVNDGGEVVHIVFRQRPASATEHLFEPFHSGADGSGLGLYVSRAVVRSYGGDLRLEARGGACFRWTCRVD